MELILEPEEVEALASALRSYLADLRMEIADTERMAVRDQLKRQERILTHLLARLELQIVDT